MRVSATGNLAPTNEVAVGSELSGLVETVAVDVNDKVVRGQLLAQIDPLRLNDTITRSRAALASSRANVGQVRQGQSATFTVDAWPGRSFTALIKRVDVGSNATTTGGSTVISFNAVLTVQNPDLILRPGMTATAEIVTSETRAVLLVPNAALRV